MGRTSFLPSPRPFWRDFHGCACDHRSIACWFVDTDYNEESFFVRQACFFGANDPYKALKTTLKAEINEEAWETLHSDMSRPFPKPESGRIAVKVVNLLGDAVMRRSRWAGRRRGC
jgi:adenine-specific DNA-methyltransferase